MISASAQWRSGAMRGGRHMKLLNVAIFLAVIGCILIPFGLLLYWSDDKEIYGTYFVSFGGSALILCLILYAIHELRRRLRRLHIVEDPRIAYIYNQQVIAYSRRSSELQLPSHSRQPSSTSQTLAVSELRPSKGP